MSRSIGQGVQFLNRHLSATMFGGQGYGGGYGGGGNMPPSEGKTQLFEFLRTLKHKVGRRQIVQLGPGWCTVW